MNNVSRYWMRLVVKGVLVGLMTVAGKCGAAEAIVEIKKVRADRVTSISFDSKSSCFLSGSQDGTVAVWEPADIALKSTLRCDGKVRVMSVAGDASLLGIGTTRGVEIWDITSGMRVYSRSFSKQITALQFVGRDTNLLLGYERVSANILDWKADTLSNDFEMETSSKTFFQKISDVAISPISMVAAVSVHNTIYLYNPATGKRIQQLTCTFPNEYTSFMASDHLFSVAFSPDGKTFVGANNMGYVRFWTTDPWEEIRTVNCSSSLDAMAFAPDGETIVVSSNRSIKSINVATGELTTLVAGLTGVAIRSRSRCAVGFSSSGEFLAIGSSDGTIEVVALHRRE